MGMELPQGTEERQAAIPSGGQPVRSTPHAATPLAAVRPGTDPTGMNKTERLFASLLESRKQHGEIADYRFEPAKLRLADRTYYTPDFMVIRLDGRIEFVETKGREGAGPGGWRDDARVKIKVAAEQFPWFYFTGASKVSKKNGGGWKFESFGPADPAE